MEEQLNDLDYTVIKWLLEQKIETLEEEIRSKEKVAKITYQLLEQYKKTLKKIEKVGE